MENRKTNTLLRDVRHYFGFLFEKGYQLREPLDFSGPDAVSSIILDSASLVIYVTNDRGHITLELLPAGETDTTRKIPLERLILTLTNGSEVVVPFMGVLGWGKRKQLEIQANLLKEHLDLLTAYFSEAESPVKPDEELSR